MGESAQVPLIVQTFQAAVCLGGRSTKLPGRQRARRAKRGNPMAVGCHSWSPRHCNLPRTLATLGGFRRRAAHPTPGVAVCG